ncbi:MAG: hypothetical protein WA628_05985 [Terriglobales bacterium]
MTRRALFVILFAGTALLAQTAAPPSVRPVAVLFSATDTNGGPVRDLSKDKVSVLDNNSPATIADIHSVGDAPLSVAIVLLASKTTFSKQKAAAVELVQKLLRSDKDHAFVITAGGTKAWPKGSLLWQADRNELIKTINSLDESTGVPDAFNYDLSTYSGETATSAARWQIESQQGAGVSVFDAIWGMMMMDHRPARRVLVIFRNPWAHATGRAQQNRDYTDRMHNGVIDYAHRLHVSIYTIGIDEPNPVSSAGIEDLKAAYGQNGIGDILREQDRQIRLQQERFESSGRANVSVWRTRPAARPGGATKRISVTQLRELPMRSARNTC